jgi:hypothetical protein
MAALAAERRAAPHASFLNLMVAGRKEAGRVDLLLEHCAGGDLCRRLERCDVLNEAEARFVAAQLALALQESTLLYSLPYKPSYNSPFK